MSQIDSMAFGGSTKRLGSLFTFISMQDLVTPSLGTVINETIDMLRTIYMQRIFITLFPRQVSYFMTGTPSERVKRSRVETTVFPP